MIKKSLDASKWWILVGLFCAIVIYLLRSILMPFFIAGAVAYIVSPFVNWLDRKLPLPRIAIVLLLYLFTLGPLGAAGYLYGPEVAHQIQQFFDRLPSTITFLIKKLLGGDEIQIMGQTVHAQEISHHLITKVNNLVGTPSGVVQMAGRAVEAIFGVFLTLAILLYFLIGDGALTRSILHALPRNRQPRVKFFAKQIDHVLGRYLRGLLLVILYAAVTAWLGLGLIFDLPYAIPISIATGFLELIPVGGPAASWVIASLAALLSGGFVTMIEVVGLYGVLRLTLDHFVAPIILGRAVTIHPVVIIFSFLAGAALLGIFGLMLAIPVAAALKAIFDSWDRAPHPG